MRIVHRRLVLGVIALLSVALSVGGPPNDLESSRPVAATSSYSLPFTFGSPSSPQPWNPSNVDLAVHVRNGYQNGGLDPTQAQHGSDCSPGTTHPVTTDVDAVFVCRDHVMTAMNAGGYGAIYMTPDHLLDFSGGTTTMTFSVDTFRTSDRDWIDLWITPFNENLELPLESWLPDLQGPPAHAIHIRMNEFNNGTIFGAEIYNNFTARALPSSWWTTLESMMTPSSTARTTFQLDVSSSHIRFGMPNYDGKGSHFWWVDTGISGLGWSQGLVQLGHHSYTPTKSNGCGAPVEQRAAGLGCAPNTWHWGGLTMSSAVPFTMIRANQRRIFAGQPTATFGSPAPANSFLRFNAISNVQISLDGGGTWQSPQLQSESTHRTDHFENYWTPIPAGTSSVMFKGQNFYGGPWYARDLSIYSNNGNPSPQPPPVQSPPPPPSQNPPPPLPSPVQNPPPPPLSPLGRRA